MVVGDLSGLSQHLIFVLFATLTVDSIVVVYSKNMTLDENGTAVGELRRYVSQPSVPPQIPHLSVQSAASQRLGGGRGR